eukprot:CAMPEP_0198283726 /NCGR_PEP_ID=MMETSP1449-20131203/3307_1 /TAXON_ID=420275 /ORGANISM="Attheya septentrionalis, Strain CCMP2084" /LENGTH=1175 /DNA_ID=CAMNT_0043980497 /DNA_START=124 /DNA_END=3651 /DNA_ORIENTATION=+
MVTSTRTAKVKRKLKNITLVRGDNQAHLPKIFGSIPRPLMEGIFNEPFFVKSWPVKLLVPRRHWRTGGTMTVPTVAGVTRHFIKSQRIVHIEIHGPPDDFKNSRHADDSSTRFPMVDETKEVLGDRDVVLVRVYYYKQEDTKKEADIEHSDDSDEDDDSERKPVVVAAEVKDIPNLVEMASYRIEDVKLIKQHGRVCELAVEFESTIFAELTFKAQVECLKFCTYIERLRELEQERSRRHAADYKRLLVSSKQLVSKNDSVHAEDGNDDIPVKKTVNILVDIVSVTDMALADTNPYIQVVMGGKEIHRSNPILGKTTDPIWTLDTGSLFLIQMTPDDFFASTGGVSFLLKDYHTLLHNDVVGRVILPLESILKAKGERKEYEIKYDRSLGVRSHKKCHLSLRIKKASEDDIQFMEAYAQYKGLVGVYANEISALPRPPDLSLFKVDWKRVRDIEDNNITLYRVKPFPDPTRPKETEWFTREQIKQEWSKPSTNWIDAGSGDLGRLHVEVLSCDSLPNMDLFRTSNPLDKTHAFVCMVYEDSLVNSDVIRDSLSPRWMPWCQRAFSFRVMHPQSDLFIGVFDFDMESSPVQMALKVVKPQHNPIGRVVVNVSNFLPETEYTVTYPLYYGEIEQHRRKTRGTITLRLRLEWENQREVLSRAFTPPPPCVVSCARKMHWQVARYTVEGIYDDKKYSMSSFARYVAELDSYKKVLPYLEEVVFSIWLWRASHATMIRGKKYYYPFHSMIAYSWGLLICWDFNYAPAFFVFCIGWILLLSNEFLRLTPSKWHKPRGYFQLWLVILFGSLFTEAIKPNQDVEIIKKFDTEEEKIEKRWEMREALMAECGRNIRKEFGVELDHAASKTGVGFEDMAVSADGVRDKLRLNPLKPVLYPHQLRLRRYVYHLRIVSSIFLWKHTYYSFWITSLSFFGCIPILFIPWGMVLRFIIRTVIILGLGPWMKIVDRCYFLQDRKMTDEEYEAKIKQQIEKRYTNVLKSITDYQVKKEKAAKFRSMKKYLYGKFAVNVPRINVDLYADIPMPKSSSKVHDRGDEPIIISRRKFGQKICGDMIPVREIQFTDGGHDSVRDVGNDNRPDPPLTKMQKEFLHTIPVLMVRKLLSKMKGQLKDHSDKGADIYKREIQFTHFGDDSGKSVQDDNDPDLSLPKIPQPSLEIPMKKAN